MRNRKREPKTKAEPDEVCQTESARWAVAWTGIEIRPAEAPELGDCRPDPAIIVLKALHPAFEGTESGTPRRHGRFVRKDPEKVPDIRAKVQLAFFKSPIIPAALPAFYAGGPSSLGQPIGAEAAQTCGLGEGEISYGRWLGKRDSLLAQLASNALSQAAGA